MAFTLQVTWVHSGTWVYPVVEAEITLNSTTAGDHVIACVRSYGNATDTFSVDCGGQAMSAARTMVRAPSCENWAGQIFYLGSLSSGGNKTVTATVTGSGSGTYFEVCAATFRGGDTSALLDTSAGATGNGADLHADLTDVDANSMIVAIATSAGGEPDGDAAYTDVTTEDMLWWDHTMYDVDCGTGGSVSVGMTSGSGQWGMTSAAFKLAGGAAPSISVAETLSFAETLD